MGLFQSYQQVFVTNAPVLLAQGKTVDSLAVGQIGILDAKTYKAVTTPTYATSKALVFVWGTPDITLGDFGGFPNENEYSKIVKGKFITRFRSNKAQRGQTPVYTVGWSGDGSDTNTLSAKSGESKSLFVKLSGTIIDKLYDKQGIIKEFTTTPKCITDCDDTCADVLCTDLAFELADQINADKDFKKFIKAKALIKCTTSPTVVTHTVYKFILSVSDEGGQSAFGKVQAAYPNETVTIIGRQGIITTYGVTKSANTAPAAYTGYNTVVPDCGTCPTGYTYTAASTGVKESCDATSPTTTAWVADGTLTTQDKEYTITLADDVCGNDRLTELSTAYPDYAIEIVSPSGSCVHSYTLTAPSAPYGSGCAIDAIIFPQIADFEGQAWSSSAATGYATCLCGLQIESAFFHRTTNECTFDAFPYENDVVHVQISNYNPDFNASPCETDWVVRQIRQVKYPQGHGAYIQHLEKESKQYDQRFRSTDPVVREVQGYNLQTDPTKFYDQYALEFGTRFYTSGGWAEQYEESWTLHFYVPEGTGTFLETAINGYLVSAGINEEGTVI